MSKIFRSFTLSMILTIGILVITSSVVVAAPSLDLRIEATEFIATSGEAFAASGGAVDAGLVCASGTVDDLDVSVASPDSFPIRVLHVLKGFNCNDFSGTFYVQMVVRLDLLTNQTTANWKIVGGTGSYTDLNGHGSLVGTPIDPGTSIFDVYDGKVK